MRIISLFLFNVETEISLADLYLRDGMEWRERESYSERGEWKEINSRWQFHVWAIKQGSHIANGTHAFCQCGSSIGGKEPFAGKALSLPSKTKGEESRKCPLW